jgi:hypothetical protein
MKQTCMQAALQPQEKAVMRDHLDETIVRTGHKQEGVGRAIIHAPDALVMCLILIDNCASVHIPQRHTALVVAADDVVAHIPAPWYSDNIEQILGGPMQGMSLLHWCEAGSMQQLMMHMRAQQEPGNSLGGRYPGTCATEKGLRTCSRRGKTAWSA